MRVTIDTPERMEELGARIARQLVAGDVVALNGELGAGKTTLTRGLGHALGVRGAVASPTFVLARTHPRPDAAPLVHVDAYRLSDAAELEDLDIDFDGSIVVVEWAEGMLDGVAESWLAVQIDRPKGAAGAKGVFDDAAEPREVTITGHGPRWNTFTL
jgi:tRNA threonylcarbamoyladenosine biosynthesis protein TsaE